MRISRRQSIVIAGIAFISLSLYLVTTSTVQQWLLRRVEHYAEQRGFPFSAERLHVEWSKLKLFLTGFVYDQNGQKVRIEHLTMDFPWDSLRHGGLRISDLQADGVAVTLHSPSPVETSTLTPTRLSRLRIDQLAIRNVSIQYSTPTSTIRIPSVSIEATNGHGAIQFGGPVAVGTQTSLSASSIPIDIENEAVRFGSANWNAQYAKYHGSGSIRGIVRWSPQLSLEAVVTTDSLAIDPWKIQKAAAKVVYREGILEFPEFRISQKDSGELTGSAKISDSESSANASWKNLNLTPAGLSANADGSLGLKWPGTNLNEVSGEAEARITSRQYGNLQANIRVAKKRAAVDIRARTPDLTVVARLDSELDNLLKGDLSQIRGTIRGSMQPLSEPAQKLGAIAFSATGILKNNILTIREIRASSRESTISGATLTVNLHNNQIRGNIPQGRIELHEFAPEVTGTVTLSADIAGSVKHPAATYALASDQIVTGRTHANNIALTGSYIRNSPDWGEGDGILTGTVHPALSNASSYFRGFASIDFSAGLHLQHDILSLQNIRAKSNASTVEHAELQLNLTDRRILGMISEARIDLRDVAPDALGTFNVTANIDGTLDHPAGSFTGNSQGIDIVKTHIDGVELEGAFTKESIHLMQLEARQGAGRLSARGLANLVSEDVHATAEVSDLKIDTAADLSAIVFVKAKADGNFRSPNIQFNGDIRDVSYRHEDHGNLSVEGSTNLKDAWVTVKSEKYSASLNGQVSVKVPYRFNVKLNSTQSPIQYGQYDAVANGDLQISGQARPFRADQIEFENFTLKGEGIDIVANGPLNSGAYVDVMADLAKLPVNKVKLEGTAESHVVVSGTVDNPLIEGSLTTRHATVRTEKMKETVEVVTTLDFTGQEISIRDAHAEYKGATANVTGHGSWKGDGNIQFQVANLRPENFVTDKPISGIASVEGELNFRKPKLEDIEGAIRFSELSLMIRDVTIQQKEPIDADLHNLEFTIHHFDIEGPDTHATVSGYADLRSHALNIDIDADTDLIILEPLLPDLHPAGRIQTRMALRGTSSNPSFVGFLNIADGEMTMERPEMYLDEVNLEALLNGDRIEISHATGKLNDGKFTAAGGTAFSASGLHDAAFQLNVERGQLEYPEGLQSEFSTALTVEGDTPNLAVRGKIDVLSASYEKDYKLSQEFLTRFAASRTIATSVPAAPSSFGDQIRLEIEVQAPGTIIVKNNIADLEASGSFRIRGTAAKPIVLGRATVLDGGELYFGPAVKSQATDTERRSDRYTIEYGSIDFNNPQVTEPNIDFEAKHDLDVKDEHYVVTLNIRGTPDTLKAELSSEPYLAQSDIVALLLTGRTYSELQGTYASYAGELALGYVSGQLSDRWLTQAGNVVGLTSVSIQPVSLANQTDLAARINVQREIIPGFSLIYAQNLNGAMAQTWIVSYRPSKTLLVRGINDVNADEIRLEVKQDLRLGGVSSKPANTAANLRLRNVTFFGTSIPSSDLEKHITKKGKAYSLYRSNQDVRSLRRYLATKGYPKARIQTQQTVSGQRVDVRFDIQEGPRIEIEFEGASVPASVRSDVQQIWMMRSSEALASRDSIRLLLREFRSNGYLQAKIVSADRSLSRDIRRFVFQIDAGRKFATPAWVFMGVEAMDIRDPAGSVMESPETFKERIESYYRGKGYLDATSTIPKLVIKQDIAHFEVSIDPGKSYTVADIEFDGNRSFESQHLREVIAKSTAKLSDTTPPKFSTTWLETARQSVVSEYWRQGFNDIQVNSSLQPDRTTARTAVRFSIAEGDPQQIADIDISGNSMTKLSYIGNQFKFKVGDPVDYTKVNLTRTKLYDTQVFRHVDIEMVPGTRGYTARVRLEEAPPWQFRYGFNLNQQLQSGELRAGLESTLVYNNLFGRAISTGATAKGDSLEQELDVFATQPQSFGRDVTNTITFYRIRDLTDPNLLSEYWGGTFQQSWKLRNRFQVFYGYTYRKVRTTLVTDTGQTVTAQTPIAQTQESFLDNPKIPIAFLNATVSRETRDNLLDSKHGAFFSNSFEYGPPGIGSSINFVRNYEQLFFVRTSAKNWTSASGIRFGAIWTLNGKPLNPTLQFFTGGNTTVRAFKQDSLTVLPGNFVLVLNQEVRHPLFWKFSGAAFIDAGQVTNQIRNIWDLRVGPGAGIRIHTPIVLIRTDFAVNVKPRLNESRFRWSFGIGQIF